MVGILAIGRAYIAISHGRQLGGKSIKMELDVIAVATLDVAV
jgi:hypothetical protein